MARPGAFKSEKRKKELNRLKKQEEKRQKRLQKGAQGGPAVENTDAEGTELTGTASEEQVTE